MIGPKKASSLTQKGTQQLNEPPSFPSIKSPEKVKTQLNNYSFHNLGLPIFIKQSNILG